MSPYNNSHHRAPRNIVVIILSLTFILAACSSTTSIVESCPDPEMECPTLECPPLPRYEDLWTESPHADMNSEAFTHWNDEDPAEIPAECAKCHSRPGFIDFLGIDGSPFGEVNKSVEPGTTLTCYTCHNEVLPDLTTVKLPSGEKIRRLGSEIACIECHQGRASTTTVNLALASYSETENDIPDPGLAFINSHSTSAATPFGTEAKGAYEYEGYNYKGRYVRGGEFFSCIQCHDPHTQDLLDTSCEGCHTLSMDDIKNIRVDTTDYDGDGDLQEGIKFEVEEFQTLLLDAIISYAKSTVGTPIAYDPLAYPYFYVDLDQNGEVNGEESGYTNRYNTWTPRLLRAAYNYNYAIHDQGAYAHNSDYILQILYDSIIDLSGDASTLSRP